jgi:ABC-type multidrug transport system fused ATPase/permease subunit
MQISGHRKQELKHLSAKKYLDAGCVCSWALTSCLFAASTFGLAAWWRQPMTPSIVLVSLSLFNALILPLNNLPWIIGSVIEAWVSASRFCEFLQQDVHAITSCSQTDREGHETDVACALPKVMALTHSNQQRNCTTDVTNAAQSSVDMPVEGTVAGHADHAIQLISASFSYQNIRSCPRSNSGVASLRESMYDSNTLYTLTFSVPKVCPTLYLRHFIVGYVCGTGADASSWPA